MIPRPSRQKQHRPRKILRRPNPPRRLPRHQPRHPPLQPKRRHLTREHPRTDTIHIDIHRRELARQYPTQMHRRRLARLVAVRAGPGRAEAGGRGVVRDGRVACRDARHARDVDHFARRSRTRGLAQQPLQPDRHVEQAFHIQRHDLVPAGLRKRLVGCSPRRARVVDQHGEAVGLGLDSTHEFVAAGFVLEVGNDVGAVARAEGVETGGGGGELGLFARGDDDARAGLHEGLRSHLPETGGAARDEDDVRGEGEEGGGGEGGAGGGVRHGEVDGMGWCGVRCRRKDGCKYSRR